jgi:hypothetical protein
VRRARAPLRASGAGCSVRLARADVARVASLDSDFLQVSRPHPSHLREGPALRHPDSRQAQIPHPNGPRARRRRVARCASHAAPSAIAAPSAVSPPRAAASPSARPQTVANFVYVIRKRIAIPSEKAIFIFVNNTLPPTQSQVGSIYEQHRDEDGFMYMMYSGENTFGAGGVEELPIDA